MIVFRAVCEENNVGRFKGILCGFFILTLEQIIIVSNKHCTYNKPIPKISHVKTLQNKLDTNNNKKVRNKMMNSSFYFSMWILFFN